MVVRKDLSKTSADIVAAEGVVRYAYVGEHLADRPSIPVLLAAAGQFKPVAGSEAEPATFEGKPVGDREPETLPGENPSADDFLSLVERLDYATSEFLHRWRTGLRSRRLRIVRRKITSPS